MGDFFTMVTKNKDGVEGILNVICPKGLETFATLKVQSEGLSLHYTQGTCKS